MHENKNNKSSFHIPHTSENIPVSHGETQKMIHDADVGKAYRLSRSAHVGDPYDLRSAIIEQEIIKPASANIILKEASLKPKKRAALFLSIPVREKITRVLRMSHLNIPTYSKKQEITVPLSLPVEIKEKSRTTALSIAVETPKKESPQVPKKKKVRFFARQKKGEKKNIQKETQKNTVLGEMIRFGVTTAIIFLVSFSVMNAPALGQLLSARLDPVGVVEKQMALEKMVDKNRVPILPTAGMKFENRKIYPSLSLAIAPLENRIVIPKIGKNVPIVGISDDSLVNEEWKQLEDDIQNALRDGVVHYPGTANPGEVGNVFITGHSSYYFWDAGEYKDVFALLHDLYVDDEFTIFWNQDVYHYRVQERKVVPPNDTSVLNQPRNKRIATLMTCTPIGTAKDRLILVAEQIDTI